LQEFQCLVTGSTAVRHHRREFPVAQSVSDVPTNAELYELGERPASGQCLATLTRGAPVRTLGTTRSTAIMPLSS
jgi:hypothetical protein